MIDAGSHSTCEDGNGNASVDTVKKTFSWILPLMLPAAVLASAAESREAAAASARLTADQIITRAVELADRLHEQEHDLRYEFLEQAIREKFDPAGRTKEHEEVTAKVYPLAGALYREVVEKNGHPLSSKEIEGERRRRDEVRRRRVRGEKKEEEDRVRFSRELLDRYRAKLAGVQPNKRTPDLRGALRAEERFAPGAPPYRLCPQQVPRADLRRQGDFPGRPHRISTYRTGQVVVGCSRKAARRERRHRARTTGGRLLGRSRLRLFDEHAHFLQEHPHAPPGDISRSPSCGT